MLYSKNTGGFYSKDVHLPSEIPSDAVEVPDDLYKEVLAGQAVGRYITGGTDGLPMLLDARPVTEEEALARLQQDARGALLASDVTVLRCYERGVKVPDEWVAYRETLRSIVSAKSMPSPKKIPDMPRFPSGS